MIEDVDRVFAEQLGYKGDSFLAELMASARAGHLCMVSDNGREIEGVVVADNNHYYLQRNWECETSIVEELKRITQLASHECEVRLDSCLLLEQKEAIAKAIRGPLTLISGGPGTGKTFLVKHLVAAMGDARVKIVAPTGKAAARLREDIDAVPVGTIHSMLDSLHADMVIVDECSMIDAALFAKLLKKITGRLVLIGDPYQLPPVEAGTVFGELCAHFTPVELKKCMRSERSEIAMLAQAVKQGNVTQLLPYLIHQDKIDTRSMILSAVRGGPLGVEAMNEKLKRVSRDEVPIIITKTSYKAGLSNGETGILCDGVARLGKKEIPLADLPPFEYAYCISIHKSQGSEYDDVTLLLPEGSEVFGRELLYTGITRAKKSVRIVAKEETLSLMVEQTAKRHSQIGKRVCAL